MEKNVISFRGIPYVEKLKEKQSIIYSKCRIEGFKKLIK